MPSVFLSYSHKDEVWKDRLKNHLGILEAEGLLDIWDDRRIEVGADWFEEIQEAMACASVAVLLVSADFLTSKFILGEEVPKLLARRSGEGLSVMPVIVIVVEVLIPVLPVLADFITAILIILAALISIVLA